MATSPQSHAGAIGLAEPGTNEEPKTEITYDVQAALVKLKETLGASEKAAEFYITSLLQHPLSADAASIEDGKLTVTQTAEGHRNTASLMHAWERSGAWQISLECILLEAELSAASDFDWAFPGGATEPGGQPDDSIAFATQGSPPLELPVTPPSGSTPSVAMETSEVNVYSSPVVATRISRFQKRLLLSRVNKNTRSNLMFAPNITLCNGQRASVSDEIHRPFVTGVRKVANRTAQFQPIIQTVSEGWCLHLHSEVTEDKGVDLQCVITESKLLDVEFARLPYSSKDDLNPDVTVQVPNVRRKSLKSSVRLAAGESLLIASPVTFKRDAPEQESMARFYLVTPTLISEREVLDIATE